MKVSIERIPVRVKKGWFSSEWVDHPTDKAVHFVVHLTEEEKEFIRHSNLMNQYYEMPQDAARAGDSRMFPISHLLNQNEWTFEPYVQNESIFLAVESGLEDMCRTVSNHIKSVQTGGGKKEFEL